MKNIVKSIIFIQLCALLFSGCELPRGGAETGKGKITLLLNENVRSIMPAAATAHFTGGYRVTFLDGSSNTVFQEERTNSNFSAPIYLDVGAYTLTVIAYTDTEKENIGAQRTMAVTVSDSPAEIPVVLGPVPPDGITKGKFKWNITLDFDVNLDTADMTIYNLSDTEVEKVNLLTDPEDETELLSGRYYVIFDLIKSNNFYSVEWRQALHVFQHLDSIYNYTFTEDHFTRNSYTVRYVFNDGTSPGFFEEPALPGETLTWYTLTYGDYYLEGWYAAPGFDAGTKWDFDTDTVNSDLILYARWQSSVGFNPPDFEVVDDKPLLKIAGANGAVLADDQVVIVLVGQPVTIEVENAGYYGGAANITWHYGSDSPVTGNSYTFNPLNTSYRQLMVSAYKDGIPYGSHIWIQVLQDGDGTEGKPRLVTLANWNAVFAEMRTTTGLTQDYKLTDDIDVPAPATGDSNWTPIGSIDTPFEGSFDGGGHTITGITIIDSGNIGMFGVINPDGKVHNLGLKNIYIYATTTGAYNYGGIAGGNDGIIENCLVTGNIHAVSNNGGIAGTNGGTIKNCYSDVIVTVSISNANNCSGGIAGTNLGTVQNCVAIGTAITGSASSGRIVGRISYSGYTGTQTNNYANAGMTVNNVIPASNTTGLSTAHGESITTTQFNSEYWWKNTYNWHIDTTAVPPAAAWDFVNVWEWDDDEGLPTLRTGQ